MSRTWKNLVIKTTLWIAAEILLNCMGLDTIADYSEFVFERNYTAVLHTPDITIVFPQVLLPA